MSLQNCPTPNTSGEVGDFSEPGGMAGDNVSCGIAPRAASAGDIAARASGGIAARATSASGVMAARDASAGDIAMVASGDIEAPDADVSGDFKRPDPRDLEAVSGGDWLAHRLQGHTGESFSEQDEDWRLRGGAATAGPREYLPEDGGRSLDE